MTLQISPIGIAIALVLYAIAFFALRPAFRALGRKNILRHLRWPLGALVLILPWADELWISWRFNEICRTTGANVFATAEVEGYLDETQRTSSRNLLIGSIQNPQAIKAFELSGYSFKEVALSDGRIWRIERNPTGLKASIQDRPAALYAFSRPRNEANAGYRILCTEDIVIRFATGERMASYRYCKRYAGMIEGLWMQFLHRGPIAYCPKPSMELKGMLYEHVLLPVKRSER